MNAFMGHDTNSGGAMKKTCSGCIHGYLGEDGIFCRIFTEIVEETVAEDCDLFEATGG